MFIYRNFLGIAVLLLIASCSAPKKTIYFNTNAKAPSATSIVETTPRPQLRIAKDDIIAINVSSVDPKTPPEQILIFNNGGVAGPVVPQSGTTGTQQNVQKGYLVGSEGTIDFPAIGEVAIAGMTVDEAKETLVKKLSDYIKDPVVEVRIINYRINMLGEVNRVGPVLAPNHKINILEAITAAGDIRITGRKDNVLIIREKEGKQEFGRVNLNSQTIFTSPYYYLQQNDIVYVEPNRVKRQEANEFLRFYLPAVAAMLTSILSVYGIIRYHTVNPK
jgi:polysaccharide biosynthesis/export protein